MKSLKNFDQPLRGYKEQKGKTSHFFLIHVKETMPSHDCRTFLSVVYIHNL